MCAAYIARFIEPSFSNIRRRTTNNNPLSPQRCRLRRRSCRIAALSNMRPPHLRYTTNTPARMQYTNNYQQMKTRKRRRKNNKVVVRMEMWRQPQRLSTARRFAVRRFGAFLSATIARLARFVRRFCAPRRRRFPFFFHCFFFRDM